MVILLFSAPSFAAAQENAQGARWMNEGAMELKQGHPAEAEADFQRAATEMPNSPDAALGIGLAQLRAGKFDAAEAQLARASQLQPSLLSAHMFRGIALFQINSLVTAEAELEAELKLQPNSSEALTWLGIIRLQAGKPKDAAIPLDKAGELSPNDQSILYYQIRAHTLAAQQSFRALFAMDGDSAYVHRAQAEIYSESQQPDKAIQEYKAALQKAPHDAELYEALGNEEQRVEHVEEARKAYEAELTINPNSAVALYNIGKIEVETGDAAKGVDLLQRAVAGHAVAAPAYFYLGFGLAKLGKNDAAVGWLEKAMQTSPSDSLRQRDEFELARVYERLGRKEDASRALAELRRLKAQPQATSQPHD